jgi:hypothetical protein
MTNMLLASVRVGRTEGTAHDAPVAIVMLPSHLFAFLQAFSNLFSKEALSCLVRDHVNE